MEMDLVFNTSIIASFLAGMVALFAPCCITVLLPAYLASVFREKRNIIKMTLVFSVGIAVVLVPIGLGAAVLAKLFESLHKEMYLAGGLLMLVLAGMSISGKGWSIIPMPKRPKLKLDVRDYRSVFFLGIFSGAATSCCAPVLAGAVTMAVISASFAKAIIVTLTYVLGMTFPLFVAAYFYDKWRLDKSRLIQGKILTLRLGSKRLNLHTTNLLAGAVFFGMGAILIGLAVSGNVFWSPSWQAQIGLGLNKLVNSWLGVLWQLPDWLWGILIFVFFIGLISRSSKKTKPTSYDKEPRK